MKKIILACAIALLSFSVFAETATRASFASNFEKFLNGKGQFVKSIDKRGNIEYMPKDKIVHAATFFNGDENNTGFRIYSNRTEIELDTYDNSSYDIYLDANGNLIIQEK